MARTYISDHPLIGHKLAALRDKNTPSARFRELVGEISLMLACEATKDLPLIDTRVETPMGVADCRVLPGDSVAVVPILRAGLGMVEGFLKLVPDAGVGHIGLYRDEETLELVEYYCKLPPNIQNREVFVVDPMLATGGSACDAISMIKKRGAGRIRLLCVIAAPDGIARVERDHPDVDIYCACKDKGLNEKGYIVPGLGDAGDRIFGTQG